MFQSGNSVWFLVRRGFGSCPVGFDSRESQFSTPVFEYIGLWPDLSSPGRTEPEAPASLLRSVPEHIQQPPGPRVIHEWISSTGPKISRELWPVPLWSLSFFISFLCIKMNFHQQKSIWRKVVGKGGLSLLTWNFAPVIHLYLAELQQKNVREGFPEWNLTRGEGMGSWEM